MLHLGVDIEEIKRIQRLYNQKPRILKKMFFESEWEYAKSKANPCTSLTGIWCAKEATLKALDPFLKIELREIEINSPKDSAPYVSIHHKNFNPINLNISISISHSAMYAVATALVSEAPAQNSAK